MKNKGKKIVRMCAKVKFSSIALIVISIALIMGSFHCEVVEDNYGWDDAHATCYGGINGSGTMCQFFPSLISYECRIYPFCFS